MKKATIYTLLILLAMMVATSCSESNNEPGGTPQGEGTVTIALGARSMGVAYRAEAPAPLANELIHTWWMAFVDGNGNVAAIVDNTLDSPKKDDKVQAQIPFGTYTVYAFANITPSELTERAGISFSYPGKMTGNPATAQWSDQSDRPDNATLIPMSGIYQNFKVEYNKPSTLTVEVVRMLGKVEFAFSNRSASPLTITGISFGPVAKGSIPLLQPAALSMLPSSVVGGSVDLSFASGNRLESGSEQSFSPYFYLREVISTHPTGHFPISVTMTREGSTTAETLTALVSDLDAIDRNDWVRIPIAITDWIIDMEVLFYPPIGGYPAESTLPDGNEFYIKLKTPGRFVINPLVRENRAGSAYIPLPDSRISVALEFNSGKEIFATAPAYDYTTGEIIGEASSATGTAEITLKLTLTTDDGNTYTPSRKIFITRE